MILNHMVDTWSAEEWCFSELFYSQQSFLKMRWCLLYTDPSWPSDLSHTWRSQNMKHSLSPASSGSTNKMDKCNPHNFWFFHLSWRIINIEWNNLCIFLTFSVPHSSQMYRVSHQPPPSLYHSHRSLLSTEKPFHCIQIVYNCRCLLPYIPTF